MMTMMRKEDGDKFTLRAENRRSLKRHLRAIKILGLIG